MPISVGSPVIGAAVCDSTSTCFVLVDDTLTLKVNGNDVQKWVAVLPSTGTGPAAVAGSPMGLLLSLTYDVDQTTG